MRDEPKIYMWHSLSIPLFGHDVTEVEIERAVKTAFGPDQVRLRHTDPVDPVHGRNGWMCFTHTPVTEDRRMEITTSVENTLPRVTVRWDGWVVETRPVVALSKHIQE